MAQLQYSSTPFSYSAAVAAGDFIFLGLHTGPGEDFVTQLDDCLKNITRTLKEFDVPLSNLVKIQVWLKNIEDLPVMEERIKAHFEEGKYPARMTATTEFINENCLVMIEGVAYRGQ
jgi:2-iminobutanoate/2-iminopropanoate deaminase